MFFGGSCRREWLALRAPYRRCAVKRRVPVWRRIEVGWNYDSATTITGGGYCWNGRVWELGAATADEVMVGRFGAACGTVCGGFAGRNSGCHWRCWAGSEAA